MASDGMRHRRKVPSSAADDEALLIEENRTEPYALADGGIIGKVPASFFAWAHAVLVFGGFFGALAIGWYFHYAKLVKNQYFGYPEEWFPSISATIGDWPPERNFFQVCMAAASGPRFALVLLTFVVIKSGLSKYRQTGAGLNQVLLVLGLLRTLFAGGWIFVTSSDDHDMHDVFMIGYLVLSFFYHLISTYLMSKARGNHFRWIGLKLFFTFLMVVNIGPLLYFFIQHKDHRIPGAYTIYSFFEWFLVFFDVGFDATTVADFASVHVFVADTQAETEAERDKNVKYTQAEEKAWDPSAFEVARKYAVDIYLGYLSWTSFTSLAVCLWYFPLLDMGLSGYEVALLAPLLAVLNGLGPVRALAQQHRGPLVILSFVGILAYLVPDTSQRLGVAGLGVAIDAVVFTALWWDPARKDHAVVALLLGLIFFLVVKVFFTTNNPLWPTMHGPNGGLQVPGLLLGVLAALEVAFRKSEKPQQDPQRPAGPAGSWLASSLGFGALIFLTHHMFTDYSVVSNWVLVGFPNPGPLPFPWGLLVVVCLVVGLNLSPYAFVVHPAWWAAGFVGAFLLYNAPTYLAFIGGLVLAVYTFSVWPALVNKMVQHPPGRTLFVGFLVYVILLLASVWVVAYPFVPAGEYLRERTHVFLFGALGLVLLGTMHAPPLFHDLKKPARDRMEKRMNVASAVLLVLMVLAALSRFRPNPYHHPLSPTADPRSLTVVIWTIRFGYDANMRFSHQRVVDGLTRTGGEVFSLVETDTTRGFMGNRDMVQWIAEKLDMYYDFGPASRNHTWGCALISKHPILWSEHLLLPSPEGELACGIHATLDVRGTPIDILVGHNGNEQHALDRKLQSQELSRVLKEAKNPIVYLGYMTTAPHSENYKAVVTESGSSDIDPTDNDRWCEYIVYKGLEKVAYGRVTHAGVTDTEIQIGKFLIGTGRDNSVEIDEATVPANLRLPEAFKGQGVDGHRYHVFDRPKYFGPAPPPAAEQAEQKA